LVLGIRLDLRGEFKNEPQFEAFHGLGHGFLARAVLKNDPFVDVVFAIDLICTLFLALANCNPIAKSKLEQGVTLVISSKTFKKAIGTSMATSQIALNLTTN
jgi:hypothetical protein